MRQRALWAAAMVGCMIGSAARGSTPRLLFVDDTAPPGGDGSSWAGAYTDLQDALDEADALTGEVEVRIAAGVYRPDRGTGDRTMSFVVRGGMALVGGFPDGGGEAGERDPAQHETALTGDLAGDDTGEAATWAENAEHVVLAANPFLRPGATVFDGLIIEGGDSPDDGAGIVASNSALQVRGCVFRRNRAAGRGGAIVILEQWEAPGPSVIESCAFESNEAGAGGGAIWLDEGVALARVVNCAFRGNRSGADGGALASLVRDTAMIDGCRFEFNEAAGRGGAVLGAATASRSHFEGNTATDGGAAADVSLIERSKFVNNSAALDGGAVAGSGVRVRWSRFVANHAARDGGALHAGSLWLEMDHVEALANSAGSVGGAVAGGASLTLRHSTIAFNRAAMIGGVDGSAFVEADSLIVWGNADDASPAGSLDAQIGPGVDAPAHSIVQGYSGPAEEGRSGEDPRFVDGVGPDGVPATGDEDLRLGAGSPAIDAGRTTEAAYSTVDQALRVLDLAGLARHSDGDADGETRIDIGAYEAQDCDADGVLDHIAIAAGLAPDCDGDGVPDGCEANSFASARDARHPMLAPARWRRFDPSAHAGDAARRLIVDDIGPGGAPIASALRRVDDAWVVETARTLAHPAKPGENCSYRWSASGGLLAVVWACVDFGPPLTRSVEVEVYEMSSGALQGPFAPTGALPPGLHPQSVDTDGERIFIALTDGVVEARRADAGWRMEQVIGQEWGGPRSVRAGAGRIAMLARPSGAPLELRLLTETGAGWALEASFTPYGGLGSASMTLAADGAMTTVAIADSTRGERRIEIYERSAEAWSRTAAVPGFIGDDPDAWVYGIATDGRRLLAAASSAASSASTARLYSVFHRSGDGVWRRDAIRHGPVGERFWFDGRFQPLGFDDDQALLWRFGAGGVDSAVWTMQIDAGCAAAPCPADLTGDGGVDGADLGRLLGAWGGAQVEADLNADGVVDGADLGLLVLAWGACPQA